MARLPLVPAGVLLGFVAGSLVFVAGAAVMAASMPLQTSQAMLDALAWAAALSPDPAGLGARVAGALWRVLVTVGLAPVGVAAALGEVTGRRSLLALSGVTGTLTVLLPLLLVVAREAGRPIAFEGSGRVIALLFLSGAASGAAYWLLAGAPATLSSDRRPGASA